MQRRAGATITLLKTARIILFLAAYIIFRQILFSGYFLDEQENWAGSTLLLQGYRLYSDFFTHHAPLPYLLGTLPAQMAGATGISYRWVVLLLWFTGGLLGVVTLRGFFRLIPGIGLVILAVAAPTFNLHQYLATTLAAAGLFLLCLGIIASDGTLKPGKRAILLPIIGSWLSVWSAPATAPAVLLLLLWFWRQARQGLKFWLITMLLIPGYFLIRRSWADFWWALFTFNTHYYAPRKLGFIGPAWWAIPVQAARFVVAGFTNLWKPLRILMLTISHTLGSPALWQVAFQSFFGDYTQLATALFLLFITTQAVMVMTKGWRLGLVFTAAGLLLQWQTVEIFHVAPFVTVLICEAVWVLVGAVERRQWRAVIGLIIPVTLVAIPFMNRYQAYVRQRIPLIPQQEFDRAARLNPDVPGSLITINASPIAYVLAHKQPAIYTYYIFPWIDAVPDYHSRLVAALASRQADYVVVGSATSSESAWLDNLQPIIDQGYRNLGSGAYVKRL